MTQHILRVIGLAGALAIAFAASAQGRHDEKPHGVPKAAAAAQTRAAATGGRHDEGPTSHGKRRVVEKKSVAAEEPSAK